MGKKIVIYPYYGILYRKGNNYYYIQGHECSSEGNQTRNSACNITSFTCISQNFRVI
jgi:hypothetical protein